MIPATPLRLSPLLRAVVLAACAVSQFAGAAPAADAVAHTRYTVAIFFPPVDGPDTAPTALNNRTQVVGSRMLPDPHLAAAAIWDGKTASEWNTFGNPGSVPLAINDAGKIAGHSYLTTDQFAIQRAVVWCGTSITYLRTLRGEYGEARAINKAGDVAGYSVTTMDVHATLWKGDQVIDLGTLGGAYSEASGINDAGDVVGSSLTLPGASYATLWTNGQVYNLGTLTRGRSQALDINNKGRIVGWSDAGINGIQHAVLWVNGKIKDLGTLGGENSHARSINDAGTIVGDSLDAGHEQRGALWHGTRIVDINSLLDGDKAGITIRSAIAINDKGEILVAGSAPNGSEYMLLAPKRDNKAR